MKFEFELSKEEVWEASMDICGGSAIFNREKRISFVYYLSWGLFWVAILTILTLALSDNERSWTKYIPEFLLAAAFFTFSVFNFYSVKSGSDRFYRLPTGNQGRFEVEFGEGVVGFSTPSGNVDFKYSEVVYLLAINKHLLMYTALWCCYVPIDKFEKDALNELVNLLEQKTSLKVLNLLPD